MLLPGKALGQDIGRLVVGGHIVKGDVAGLNLVAQEVITDVDMFGAVVELGVLCDSDRRLIVNVKWNGERWWLL